MKLPRLSLRSACLASVCLIGLPAFAADEKIEWLPDGSLGTAVPSLADPTGMRKALWERGIKFGLNYIGEVQGVTNGGLQRGSRYGGRLELVIDADLEKMVGWGGAAFHANAYQIHGTGISRYNLGNLLPVSNIEALPSTRLYEAWIEQKFMENKVALRFGQQGADSEFVTSNYAGLFINGTFGWPTLNAANLPSGGPAYPLATPAVRLGLYPTDSLSLLLGIFNGDPAGPGLNDPQQRDRNGLKFRTRDPAFAVGELQYKYGDDKAADSLSGVVKIGAWNHFGRFADTRYGLDGLPLASPLSSGAQRLIRGDSGVYGIVDQQVYRLADDPTKGIGVFGRLGASPGNRNLVDFYADAGINFTGLVPGRSDDAFGLAVSYASIGSGLVGLSQDTNFFTGVPAPVRSSEALLEVTYSAQIMPGWTIQPNLQYVVRPGGNVADPADPTGTRAVRNATVIGVRSTLKY